MSRNPLPSRLAKEATGHGLGLLDAEPSPTVTCGISHNSTHRVTHALLELDA